MKIFKLTKFYWWKIIRVIFITLSLFPKEGFSRVFMQIKETINKVKKKLNYKYLLNS